MMNNVKKLRLQKWIKIQLVAALNNSKKVALKKITISDVKLSNDFHYAVVLWMSFEQLSAAKIAIINQELENIKGYLRTCLAKVSSSYTVPQLRFKYDKNYEQITKLEKIFHDLNDNNS